MPKPESIPRQTLRAEHRFSWGIFVMAMLEQLTCSECQLPLEKGKRQGGKVKSPVYVKPGAKPLFLQPSPVHDHGDERSAGVVQCHRKQEALAVRLHHGTALRFEKWCRDSQS